MGDARARRAWIAAWVFAVVASARASERTIARAGTRGVIEELVWVSHASVANSRVFLVTESREVLASVDDGKTFEDLCRETRLRGCEEAQRAPVIVAGRADERGALAGPAEIVIQDAQGRYFWGSTDLGDTWIQPCEKVSAPERCFANPGKEVPGGRGRTQGAVSPHPTRAGWLLAAVRTCDAWTNDAPRGVDCSVTRLLVSGDFGATWSDSVEKSKGKIATFVDYDWAPDDGSSSTPPIYATVFRDAGAFARHRGGWDYNIDLIRSHDGFASHEVVQLCANAFEILNDDVYSASPPDCDDYHKNSRNRESSVTADDITLKISVDKGKTFETACFPMNLPKNGFVIFDFHSDSAGPDFISVDHEEENDAEAMAPMNELYASDESLELFSLSMRTLVRSEESFATQDFVPVLGLDGVYIANQISYKAFIDGFPGSYSDFYETRISFNAGGTWHRIPAPEMDSEGVKYACSPDTYDCSRYGLHLHGEVDWDTSEDWEGTFGGVYSRSTAPGVIISTGNVGDSLTDDESQVNTYISRDGGVTWFETKRGAYIYEFGNHGGLLVIAKQFEAVDEIEYSLNQGKSWTKLKLASSVYVHNIRVDPSSKGHVFIIHGATDASAHVDQNRGSYFVVDFDDILTGDKICGDADYELWTPVAPGGSGCLMGQKLQLKRRKLDVECFNDGDVWRERQLLGTCACSRQYDTECDYGSERVYNVPNASDWPHCSAMSNVNTHCPTRSHLSVRPSNLRIVSGDKCSGAAAALGEDDSHDGHRRHHRHGGGRMFFRFVMFVSVATAAVYGAIYVKNNYDLGTLSSTIPNAARNAVNGAYEKLQDAFGKREQATPPGYFEPLGDFAADDEI